MVIQPFLSQVLPRNQSLGLLASVFQDIDSANDCRHPQITSQLLGRECVVLTGIGDHLAHFAYAFGTLSGALVAREDVAGPRGPGLDCEGDVALAKTVAVADVHGEGFPDQT